MLTRVFLIACAISSAAFAELYNLNPSLSSINWSCSKKVGSTHNGTIDLKSAQADTITGELRGASFTIAMDTIKNTDLTDPKLNTKLVGHLKSDDFFGVGKFPTSVLKIISTTREGKTNKYKINAELTIKDKTNPVNFVAEVTQTQEGYMATSKFNIDRTKWGIVYGSEKGMLEAALKAAVDKIIKDEISFDVKIAMTKEMSKTAAAEKPATKAKKGN